MSEATEGSSLDGIKQAEQAWHEAVYSTNASFAFPDTVEQFREVYPKQQLIPFCEGGWSWWADARQEALDAVGDVQGLRVLDYGCGYGGLGMYLSLAGAQVWGFDLSRIAIETANKAAERYGLSAHFEQMDGEKLMYADDFFDVVIGFGVLHHVIKYRRAASELFRILKPNATAVCHETLWDNPLINLARRVTTEPSQAGDAHLGEQDILEFGQEFSQVRLEKRHFLYMFKRVAQLPRPEWFAPLKPRPFWRMVKALDDRILRFAPLQRYCGEVIVFLQK
jgi:2-polyprenyl-3-methyl-5-hydroxy-6-metoxy-1,4-benzoquinol methylase